MNYKKIYSQALKTILGGRKGVVLRQFTKSADGKDLLTFDNYGLFFIPKELNIFAEHVGTSLSAHDVCKLIPKKIHYSQLCSRQAWLSEKGRAGVC